MASIVCTERTRRQNADAHSTNTHCSDALLQLTCELDSIGRHTVVKSDVRLQCPCVPYQSRPSNPSAKRLQSICLLDRIKRISSWRQISCRWSWGQRRRRRPLSKARWRHWWARGRCCRRACLSGASRSRSNNLNRALCASCMHILKHHGQKLSSGCAMSLTSLMEQQNTCTVGMISATSRLRVARCPVAGTPRYLAGSCTASSAGWQVWSLRRHLSISAGVFGLAADGAEARAPGAGRCDHGCATGTAPP